MVGKDCLVGSRAARGACGSMKIRVTHIINSFESGGAEAMLCHLLLKTDRDRFEPSVVSLIDDVSVAGPVLAAGIPLSTMGVRPGVPDPRGMTRLVRQLRLLRPAVVQTWMDHSNLIGGIGARLAGTGAVVWGIHHSDHVRGLTKRTTLLTVRACALLSRRLPARIICCSEHARSLYQGRGFAAEKLTVIPNGFDTSVFRPDAAARAAVRQELGLDKHALLIGLVARYHPLKDHANFLDAAAELARACPSAHFLLCGNRVDQENVALTGKIAELGLQERCHLLGRRQDVARIHAALDLSTSSSVSEAFPLVLGESMACGVPCVATDVGDSARIVGDTGRIVPPRDSRALAGAWLELLQMPTTARRCLGKRARKRVQELFELDAVTRRYEATYEELAVPARETGNGSPRETRLRPVNGWSNGNGSSNGHGIAVSHGTAGNRSSNGKPIRVLMVVESSAGGTGRHILDLSQGLVRRGCEVHLLYSTVRIDKTFIDRLAAMQHLHATPLPMRKSIHASDVAVVRAVRKYLSSEGPFDVIHGHSSKGGAIARLAALGTGVPAFYTLHGLIMVDPSLALWKRVFYFIIELGLSFRTARIIAVSPEEARAAVRIGLGRSRVVLVPNGIDRPTLAPRATARAALRFCDKDIVIGFVGRLVDQKAPEVLIDAFALAAGVEEHLRLVIVGSGPLEVALRERAARRGVAERVRWLAERDAREVLAAMDVFALSSRKEGLPYVVLEAMAAGLPVVATSSAGVEILVESGVNGAVVATGQAPAFAAALLELAGDADRRARYGRASHERVARFTVDRMVEGTLESYGTATNGHLVSEERVTG